MEEFEKIYQVYFTDVYLYIKGLSKSEEISEEITSETFFKAMGAIKSFRGECDIRVWLCQIAKNCYYTYLKKNNRLAEYEDITKLNLADNSVNIEENFTDKSNAMAIHILLHNLKEPYKEVFSLRVFGELSFKQIAKIFNRSENWACVTYHRARQKLMRKLEEESLEK